MADAIGTTPIVGLSEAMPQQWAGFRSDPPMSLPSPIGLIPEAIADASPPLDPPAVTLGFHGFRVSPCNEESVWTRRPKSGRFVRANGIAPAARIRSTVGESHGAIASAKIGTPSVVGRPCDVDVLLHRARHTVQRAEHLVVRHGLVGAVGGGQGVVGQQADDGVDVLVHLEHTGEVGLHDLPTRHLLGGDFPGQFECSQLP